MAKKPAPKAAPKEPSLTPPFMRSSNKGRGYHGMLYNKHKGDIKAANQGYHDIATKIMKVCKVGEGGHEKVKHYLDSQHGRMLHGHEHKPEYMKLDFNRFTKTYDPQAFYTEEKQRLQEGRKWNAMKRAFTKTFKDEWPDNKLDWKDGAAAVGYTAAGAAAGAVTGAATKFNPIAGAVIGGGNYVAGKLNSLRKNYSKAKTMREDEDDEMEDDFEDELESDDQDYEPDDEIEDEGEYEDGDEEVTDAEIEMHNNIPDLVDAIMAEKPANAQEVLDDIMAQKVAELVDAYKTELATNVISDEDDEDEDPELSDDDIEAIENGEYESPDDETEEETEDA
jgi:hypothetical protein